MIEVNHLVKRYGNTLAVDDLSFTVEEGQIYGFLGTNGAGKSTTLNIITGYIAPTSGEVSIDGHNILEEPEEARKCIGYLPEIPPLYTDMTVEEYLAFAAELKKISKGKIRGMLDEIMDITGLAEMRSRLIRNLSKGYRQRTGLAQAILGYPKIIILDEPMVGLDPKQIIEIRDLIRNLGKEHTVILSSHILSEVSAVCDQIMIISHGKLAANDTPENLEKLMEGSNTLNLTVKGDALSLQRILKQMAGILSCSVTSSEEKGVLDVVIKTEAGLDLREQLFYLLADQKIPILSLQQSRVSLETVFLELTGDVPSEVPEKSATGQEADSDERSDEQ